MDIESDWHSLAVENLVYLREAAPYRDSLGGCKEIMDVIRTDMIELTPKQLYNYIIVGKALVS